MLGDPLRTIVVTAPVGLDHRDPIGALVRAVCSRLELGGRARSGMGDQVISAFNEAFNNLVIHGRRPGGEPRCEVEIEATDSALILRLKDHGPGFDMDAERPVPRASDPGEGGYGLHIIRSFMSAVHYERGEGGAPNVLTMVRALDATG
jgi:serine/threonine-protein kinase RsbW